MKRLALSLATAALAFVVVESRGESTTTLPPPAVPTAPCATDIARFCKDVARGDGRLRSCLLTHASELAAACRARMQATSAPAPVDGAATPVPERLAACAGDLRSLCPGVPAGGGKLRACLDLHIGKLSTQCAAALRGRAKGGTK